MTKISNIVNNSLLMDYFHIKFMPLKDSKICVKSETVLETFMYIV